jgi:hypothetical protein
VHTDLRLNYSVAVGGWNVGCWTWAASGNADSTKPIITDLIDRPPSAAGTQHVTRRFFTDYAQSAKLKSSPGAARQITQPAFKKRQSYRKTAGEGIGVMCHHCRRNPGISRKLRRKRYPRRGPRRFGGLSSRRSSRRRAGRSSPPSPDYPCVRGKSRGQGFHFRPKGPITEMDGDSKKESYVNETE